MNIFASFPDPAQSAAYLDDTRVIKMALESTQLCATAIHLHGGISPYKPSHINHPATQWTAKNLRNFSWVAEHGLYCCREYYQRFHKIHKCANVLLYLIEEVRHSGRIPDDPNPIVFKFIGSPQIDYENECVIKDVHQAYRQYLWSKWRDQKRPPKWYGKEDITKMGLCIP